MLISVKGGSAGEASCPLCREAVQSEARGRCADCNTHYHRSCFLEFGGCSTLGCPSKGIPAAGSERRPAAPREAPQVCDLCGGVGSGDEPLEACPRCETEAHAACLRRRGGCRGCPPREARREPENPLVGILPLCGVWVLVIALAGLGLRFRPVETLWALGALALIALIAPRR